MSNQNLKLKMQSIYISTIKMKKMCITLAEYV